MDDILSKVVAMILGCLFMFIIPVRLLEQRQKNMFQTYVFTETAYLVDCVCNKGILYREEYGRYLEKLAETGELYTVFVQHYTVDNGAVTMQVKEMLIEQGDYAMKKGDLLKITVTDSEGQTVVVYGGCIKDEDY